MDEELGPEVVAALDAIAPNWRREIGLRWLDPGWQLSWQDRGSPELIAVLLRSTAIATLREIAIHHGRVEHLAGLVLPAVERIAVHGARFHDEFPSYARGSDVAMAPLLALAPALTSLTIAAETIRIAASERLRELQLFTRSAPDWTATSFPSLAELTLHVGVPVEPDAAAWLLDGKLAPALRTLSLRGCGASSMVAALPAAPAVERLRALEVVTDVSEETGRALVTDLGHLARVKRLSFRDLGGRRYGSSQSWLTALERRPAERAAIAHGLLRGQALFLAAPHPAVRCWELKATGTGTAGVLQIPHGMAGGPTTLEEALCALVGAWRRYSSSGWFDPSREFGKLARFEPGAWESMMDRAVNLFGALEPAAFDAALDTAIDTMHAAIDVRVTENYARLLPRTFTPPVGPANRAYVATDEANDKLMVAETDDAYVLLVWIS